MITPEDLQIQLQKVLEECASLREENERLKKLLGLFPEDLATTSKPTVSEPLIRYDATCPPVTKGSPTEDQVTLFRSLFRGREDIYAVRWEAKKGNSGYSPACAHEWERPLCGKPKTKCADCENREFKPLTDQVILDHLLGKHTIGVIPFFQMKPVGSLPLISTRKPGRKTR